MQAVSSSSSCTIVQDSDWLLTGPRPPPPPSWADVIPASQLSPPFSSSRSSTPRWGDEPTQPPSNYWSAGPTSWANVPTPASNNYWTSGPDSGRSSGPTSWADVPTRTASSSSRSSPISEWSAPSSKRSMPGFRAEPLPYHNGFGAIGNDRNRKGRAWRQTSTPKPRYSSSQAPAGVTRVMTSLLEEKAPKQGAGANAADMLWNNILALAAMGK